MSSNFFSRISYETAAGLDRPSFAAARGMDRCFFGAMNQRTPFMTALRPGPCHHAVKEMILITRMPTMNTAATHAIAIWAIPDGG